MKLFGTTGVLFLLAVATAVVNERALRAHGHEACLAWASPRALVDHARHVIELGDEAAHERLVERMAREPGRYREAILRARPDTRAGRRFLSRLLAAGAAAGDTRPERLFSFLVTACVVRTVHTGAPDPPTPANWVAPRLGLWLYRAEPAPLVGWADTDSPAARADVRPGDLLVAIDDRPANAEVDPTVLRALGTTVDLTLERDGMRLRVKLEGVTP